MPTLAQLIDVLAVTLAFTAPIALVWRWRIAGAIAGTFVQWSVLLAMSPILSALDPNRDAAMFDAVWMTIGSLFALAYSGVVLLAISMLRGPRRRMS